MIYVKPQSPIRKGDTGIYPLTTYDQIIMKDGSRFNGNNFYIQRGSISVPVLSGAQEKVYTINFSQPMPNTNYSVVTCVSNGGLYWTWIRTNCYNKSINGFSITVRNDSSSQSAACNLDWIAVTY